MSRTRLGALVAALGSERLDHLGSLVALSRVLGPRLQFVAFEVANVHRLGIYRLHESGLSLCVEHNTPDVLVVDEVFYRRLYEPPSELESLPRAPRVLDVGANIGCFGVWMLGLRPEADLVAFEPDPRNLRLLQRTIAVNSMQSQWQVVAAAAGPRDGTVQFAQGGFATSHVVRPDEESDHAIGIPMADLFEWVEGVDLIKLDIEGGEWEIFSDDRFPELDVPALIFEYHPERCPRPNPHLAAREAMQRAGYATRPVFEAPSGVGMLWAFKRSP